MTLKSLSYSYFLTPFETVTGCRMERYSASFERTDFALAMSVSSLKEAITAPF
jgi:hypothetical protein